MGMHSNIYTEKTTFDYYSFIIILQIQFCMPLYVNGVVIQILIMLLFIIVM